ncbi:Cell wall hydrolase/autolysin, catalytic [Moorella glycerini]|uniref:N-acetylmuramoyl-L-alanine amidase AmiC n=1 Tax=Neomoorella stamsii TaxID=1266720 RepID=A0A9X7J5B2_9FIRM|nr:MULTISPECIES: N-acetylmuramoyl-L-alanine amidase [Moorella]PRR76337.1 N-acetylmuramoyl-L-alanine amidase AmiC precursor [Moorella stamsii]CEP67095.1 Cell wall hydrolase/autolysin, catalytic [Moorella glycerini]
MDRRISTGRWGLLLLLLVLMYILTLGLKALPAAASPGVTLILNGTRVDPAVPPYIDGNGRTMVPLRFVMEYMGARVDWVEEEQGIVVNRGATTLKMWIGSRRASVNGQAILLDTTPVLKGNTTMVPVRFISQAFGGQVDWNATSQTVRITLGTVQSASQVRLTGSYVNIRSGPGLDYNIIDVLPRGTVLRLIDEAPGWYQVQLNGGRQGWVSAAYAEPVYDNNSPGNGGPPGENPPTGGTQPPAGNPLPGDGQPPAGQPLGLAVVGSRPVAILAGPSPVEKQVGTAAAGSKLPIWQKKGDWWQVEMANGQRGWLASALATFAPYEPQGNDPGGQKPRVQITGVTVVPSGGALQVTVKASGVFTYKTSFWDNRLIVDVSDAVLVVPKGQETVEVNRSPLARVRLGQFTADTVRIVFDLIGAARLRFKSADKSGTIFLIEKPSLNGSKIVIDPGHGTDTNGADPGAIGPTGVKEKDVNLAIAQKLAALLRSARASVYLTRNGETCPYTLAGRAYYANDLGADLFISIHSNASYSPDASGTSTYFYAPPDTALGQQREERRRLAAAIQSALVAATGRKDLGILEANFSVLRNTEMPSVLVETAFISNPTEEQLLNSPAFQARVAEGIFNGISAYFTGN